LRPDLGQIFKAEILATQWALSKGKIAAAGGIL